MTTRHSNDPQYPPDAARTRPVPGADAFAQHGGQSEEADGAGTRPGVTSRAALEVPASSLAQRRLEAGSLFPGPPQPQGRATALAADVLYALSGFASAALVGHLFGGGWGRAVVIAGIIAVFTLVQRISARRRRAGS